MSSAQEEDLVDYSGAYLIASIKDSKWYLMDPANAGSYYPSLATDLAADPANDGYSLFEGVDNIDDYVFTVAAYDGAYSIKNESTGKYVAYHGSSNEAFISFIRRMCMAAEVADLKGMKRLVKNVQKDVNG